MDSFFLLFYNEQTAGSLHSFFFYSWDFPVISQFVFVIHIGNSFFAAMERSIV